MATSQDTVKGPDVEVAKSEPARVKSYLQSIVDNKKCNPISIYGCFLTGFTSAMSFSVSQLLLPVSVVSDV